MNNRSNNNKTKKALLIYGGVIIFIIIALVTIMFLVRVSNNVEASNLETENTETYIKNEPTICTESVISPTEIINTEIIDITLSTEITEIENETKNDILEIESNNETEEPVEPENIRVLPNGNIPLDYELQQYIEDLCVHYNVPIEIVLGCIQIESNFLDYAVNSSGDCVGYMQINTCNWYWLNNEIGIFDLSEPFQNVHSGIYILSYYYERYNDWNEALVCYNNGEELAKLYFFNEGFYSSTYSRTVMEYAEEWADVIYE